MAKASTGTKWVATGMAGVAGLLAIGACTTTVATTTPGAAPPVTATSPPGTTGTTGGTSPRPGPSTTPGSSKKAGTSTTGLASAADPVVNTWTAANASGPLAAELQAGGRAYCTYNSHGNVWQLFLPDKSSLGSVDFEFTDAAAPEKATVTILGTGGKKTAAEGSASVAKTESATHVVSFSFGLSYRTPDGASGDLQGQGYCSQEQPRN